MRRALAALVLVMSACGFAASVSGPASATPVRSLLVSGAGTGMYPAFDPAIDRYALTTTGATAGTVDVTATPGPDETVTVSVDGTPAADQTHLTGVQPGDRITVGFTGGAAPHVYTVLYLPSGFPKLTVTTGAQGAFPDLAQGLVAVTLAPYGGLGTPPSFDAIVDRNGVPVYAVRASPTDNMLRHFDLKQQPSGQITMQVPTTAADHTGYDVAVLDPTHDFAETARYAVNAPRTNTDLHDSVRLADGSTILIGYEPNAATGRTDGVIQKLDAAGELIFDWDTSTVADESVVDPNTHPDYAHLNSVVSVEHGDIIASFRALSAAYRIATVAHGGVQPGQVIWKLGGKDSTFAFPNDELGGPCGQHTVSELPNGHILVFDNGTDGLCVNPVDRSGPAINRGFTRVTEYALDLSATPKPTATLVWQYPAAADVGRYSLFAGSARRFANGDTLIGWASDTSTLATEVDAEGQKRWEMTTPAGSTRYMSYRAELITTLEPRLVLTGPADGASVIVGDDVPASATCLDWRSEPLADCAVEGVTGGVVDTATTGSRSWQVTATDGAGNTATVTRHYTVRQPVRLPDGQVRKGGSTWWKGNDVQGSAGAQTVRQQVRRRHTVTSYWRVQNDGERPDAFQLGGTAGSPRMRVHYFSGDTDITRAVVGGTYLTTTLSPTRWTTVRVEVTATRRSRSTTTRTFGLRSTCVSDATRSDQIAVRVVRR